MIMSAGGHVLLTTILSMAPEELQTKNAKTSRKKPPLVGSEKLRRSSGDQRKYATRPRASFDHGNFKYDSCKYQSLVLSRNKSVASEINPLPLMSSTSKIHVDVISISTHGSEMVVVTDDILALCIQVHHGGLSLPETQNNIRIKQKSTEYHKDKACLRKQARNLNGNGLTISRPSLRAQEGP